MKGEFGRWQSEILWKLRNTQGGYWLRDILGETFTQSEYTALLRSCEGLARAGYVKKLHRRSEGRGRFWIVKGKRRLPEVPAARYVVARIPLQEE